MANEIKLKRGSGSDPSASDLVVGEPAIRTDTGELFLKKDDNSVAKISGGGITDGDKGDITVSSSGSTFTIDDGVVSTAKIADDAITAAKIATNTITNAEIAANTIGTGVLAANAVITDRINNAAVTTAKLADDAVTGAKIADDSIDSEHYVDGSIDTAHIADDQVTFAKIQNIAQNKFAGRISSGTGNLEQLTAANVRSIINVEDGATADQSASEIKTAYESNSDTNAFTDALLSKLNGIAASATNVTNNNQLTNGAGYITATLTNEQVQDIVGGMLSGNTETGIAVTYQDGDGTIDFVVSSQTDENFTTTLKNKLDGIAAGATNVTNTNQLTNGAGFITATLTNEQVQDIVGGMVSGNTESGITVTYQDSDGTLDFSVASQTDNNFTTTLKNKLDGIAAGATNVTNTNQLTNGAGFITATLTNEQVQDIVGGMVSGNTESGITVTYQDSDGTLDFSVASQTDNNFTTTLKNKLDGIAAGATNVTNNNQISNGAGYLTSSSTLNSSNLSGALPALDGSNLTGISAGATGGGSDEVFYENDQTVTTNYTITNGKNAMAAGPITINSGVTVTVGSGETLTIV